MEGDQQKMREACKAALSELYKFGQVDDGRIHLSDIVHVANARGELEEALAKPPRNCDIGTADEQAKRLNEWCNGRHCVNCQFKGGWPDECKLKWAQMPYAEVRS